jgi:hypothetical protein
MKTDLDAERAPLCPNRADIDRHLFELFSPTFVHPHSDGWIEIAYGFAATGGAVNAAEKFSVFDLEKAADFAEQKNKAGFNVYVGVAVRQGETDREANGRASRANFLAASRSWAEFDKPGDDARIDAILREKKLRPSEIVTTGSTPCIRAHLYFKLEGNVTADQLEAVNAALKTLFSSDAVQNPDRVMRLAGTINYPKKDKLARGYVPELVTLYLRPDAPGLHCRAVDRSRGQLGQAEP